MKEIIRDIGNFFEELSESSEYVGVVKFYKMDIGYKDPLSLKIGVISTYKALKDNPC